MQHGRPRWGRPHFLTSYLRGRSRKTSLENLPAAAAVPFMRLEQETAANGGSESLFELAGFFFVIYLLYFLFLFVFHEPLPFVV